MLAFYLLALLPILIGGIMWIHNPKVNWIEFACGSALALLVAGIMHIVAIKGVTDDTQTLSGEIVQVRQFSQWREYYEYAVYRTETYTETQYSNGKSTTVTRTRQVFSHWQPTTRTHSEYWIAYSNIDSSYSIDKTFFLELEKKFGGSQPVAGDRTTGEHNSRMIGGDPNDYVSNNKSDYIQPVTKIEHWTNKIKGTGPSTFSFKKLTPEEIGEVYDWPKNDNPWNSDRVLNAPIDTAKWDRMNSRLGPSKHVNVIIANFDDKSPDIAELQRARWLNGKKNDLVLVYGKGWADCFGWTKSEIVKSNLRTILLDNPVDDGIIPLIEEEIRQNYEMREFEKDFDYLDIEPRGIHYFWLIFTMILTQGGFWFYAHKNQFDKAFDKPFKYSYT